MNWPNFLTISRFFLAAGFMILISNDSVGPRVLGGGLFALAAVTDWLDGYLARKYQLISGFGKILDPIADKFLTLGALMMFALMGLVVPWMCVVIAVREILVTLARFWALSQGKVLAAEKMGKYKTVLQFVTLGALIAFSVSLSAKPGMSGAWVRGWRILIDGLMIATLVLTVFSGFTHYYQNREVYRV